MCQKQVQVPTIFQENQLFSQKDATHQTYKGNMRNEKHEKVQIFTAAYPKRSASFRTQNTQRQIAPRSFALCCVKVQNTLKNLTTLCDSIVSQKRVIDLRLDALGTTERGVKKQVSV